MPAPNGTAVNGGADAAPTTEISTIPPVVGINFGNSYASIAVFTKEGLAECIANEDGERQIACAVSFHGEQTYIGNPAKQQLVKNGKNTIVGFRNLLGKPFSEIPQASLSSASAPVIQHPEQADVPAYTVDVLLPAPKPLPTANVRSPLQSAAGTPAASGTPASEPIPSTRTLSVSEVTSIFLSSLIQSAQDFLGKKVEGAVLTCPSSFTSAQKEALQKAAEDAGITVLQLLDEAGAVAVTTGSDLWMSSSGVKQDRTQLIVDLGSSSLSLSLVSTRSGGLSHLLSSSHNPDIGADKIDDSLITFFASEFTKKTKAPLAVCPSSDPQDQRAEAKLRLAAEHTKRTLSASASASCSVESLKDGMDFSGTINRLRFDMLAKSVYQSVSTAISSLLSQAGVDPVFVDEVVYVGGTTALPGLDAYLMGNVGFNDEEVVTPFGAGTLVGGGVGDPTTILSRGCAVQAALISSLSSSDEEDLKAHFASGEEVKVTSKEIGLVFPSEEGDGTYVEMIKKDTPLPARREVVIDLTLPTSSTSFAFEVYESTSSVRIEKVKPPKPEYSDDEDVEEEEEEEEIEEKHREVKRELLLLVASGEAKKAEKGKTKLTVTAIVSVDEKLEVWYKEEGGEIVKVES